MTIKLVCPECRRENEPERIYCHECGARLDRTALAKLKPTTEDPQAAQKRLRSMLDPQRAMLRHNFFKFSKLILGALVLAALLQMIIPPDVPARPKGLVLPPQIILDLEDRTQSPGSAPLRYSDQDASAYLYNSLKSKQTALTKFNLLKFERAMVTFDEGVCHFTVERSLGGFPLYTTTIQSVALSNGTVTAANRGGKIGRMRIHPAIMKSLDVVFSDVGKVLERDRKAISKMAAIEFHPHQVVIVPHGMTAAQPQPQPGAVPVQAQPPASASTPASQQPPAPPR